MSIYLDPDDSYVSCLSIPNNQLPENFLEWLEDTEPYEYMDTSDLREHMYSIDQLREDPQYREELDTVLEEIVVTYGTV